MYLLDTNIVSELRRPAKADPGLVAWASAVPSADMFISAVTLFELELGAASVSRRDAAQGATLRIWLESRLVPAFRGRILPVDAAVA